MSADRVDIGNAIIAGIAEGGTCLEQMAAIMERLRLSGYEIVATEKTESGPQVVCCVCGEGPIVRLTPPLCAKHDTGTEQIGDGK